MARKCLVSLKGESIFAISPSISSSVCVFCNLLQLCDLVSVYTTVAHAASGQKHIQAQMSTVRPYSNMKNPAEVQIIREPLENHEQT